MTPFEAVYGRPPPTVLPYFADSVGVHAVDLQLLDRDVILARLKADLLRAQQRMTKYARNVATSNLSVAIGFILSSGRTVALHSTLIPIPN